MMLQETHILRQLLYGAVLSSHTAILVLLLTFCFLNFNICVSVVLLVGVYACANTCVHRWKFIYRPEVNTVYLPQLLPTFCSETGSH